MRLLNASADHASLDLLVDGVTAAAAVTPGALSSYATLGTAAAVHSLNSTGLSTVLSSTSRTLVKDHRYTTVAYGWAGALKTALVEENMPAAASGQAQLAVANLAPDAGALDVYVTGSSDTLDSAVPLAADVAGGASAGFATLGSGSYRLRVTGSGNKADLRLDAPLLTLPSTGVATLVLTSGRGGVLVQGLLLNQSGPVDALANSQARARVVSTVAGNAVVAATLGGTTLLGGVASPTIGDYRLTGGGSAALQLTVAGQAVSLPAQPLVAGGDYTVLVWGAAAQPQVTLIADDNRLPTGAGQAKLRLVHGVSGYDTALTLRADGAVVATGVAQGQAASFASLAGHALMRLELSTPGAAGPFYTVIGADVSSPGVYTLFVLGDSAAISTTLRKER